MLRPWQLSAIIAVCSLAPLYPADAVSWDLRILPNAGDGASAFLSMGKAFYPDGRRLAANLGTGAIRDARLVVSVDCSTGKQTTLYDAQSIPGVGPGIAAVACFPVGERVVFLRGPDTSTGLGYERYRRFGAILGGGRLMVADARDVTPPYTSGALRGGTHVHDPGGPGGQWLGFTYNDEVMRARGLEQGVDLDLRTIGVTRLGMPVEVDKHPGNWNGQGFSVLLVAVTPNPTPGTNELSRAEGDGWVGLNGYVGADGVRHTARAFTGTLADHLTDVFVVDLPDDITRPGADGPLEGTTNSFPAPPDGTVLHRVTHVGSVTGYVRSSTDGSMLIFQALDQAGQLQLFAVSVFGGTPKQLTQFAGGVTSDAAVHPSEDWAAVAAEGRIQRVDFGVSETATCPLQNATLPGSAGNLSFSSDGSRLAFNVEIDGVQRIAILESPSRSDLP